MPAVPFTFLSLLPYFFLFLYSPSPYISISTRTPYYGAIFFPTRFLFFLSFNLMHSFQFWIFVFSIALKRCSLREHGYFFLLLTNPSCSSDNSIGKRSAAAALTSASRRRSSNHLWPFFFRGEKYIPLRSMEMDVRGKCCDEVWGGRKKKKFENKLHFLFGHCVKSNVHLMLIMWISYEYYIILQEGS